jgi:hypothetical protein
MRVSSGKRISYTSRFDTSAITATNNTATIINMMNSDHQQSSMNIKHIMPFHELCPGT